MQIKIRYSYFIYSLSLYQTDKHLKIVTIALNVAEIMMKWVIIYTIGGNSKWYHISNKKSAMIKKKALKTLGFSRYFSEEKCMQSCLNRKKKK